VWENVVTSCAPCNLRKGNRLPEELQMSMLVKPRVPTPALFVTLSTASIPDRWEPYLSAFA
jgi:5-methylcytosine-specific restriction endonuclease McrA